ncbi:MAG: molecular chaperone DnaJ, partial [Acidimicrobiia bacterium]|nr:molecular chaperone DnaJ [Acidimicrobiia bacterium]
MNREWVDKDFYQILGVGKEATAEEVKRAYRKLARKYHPDTNPGDKTAEDRFKEISEAYGVLSNAEQKKEYDEVRRLVDSGGFGGFGGGGPFGGGQRARVEDLGNLFGGIGDLFGFGNGGGRRGPQRGADATADLTLSFEDSIRGVTTTVPVRGETTCSRCSGRGAEPGTAVTTCPTCGGTGSVAQNQGMFSFAQPCPQCGGSGRLISDPCKQCRGRGREVRSRSIKVRIPAGVNDGATVRLAGKGGPGGGGPAGDLLVRIHVTPHRLFTRRGDDLTITVPLSYTEAALGATLEIPTLDGTVNIKVPPGTPTGKTFRVKGKGVEPERRPAGDLYVKVVVVVPRKVSREERK